TPRARLFCPGSGTALATLTRRKLRTPSLRLSSRSRSTTAERLTPAILYPRLLAAPPAYSTHSRAQRPVADRVPHSGRGERLAAVPGTDDAGRYGCPGAAAALERSRARRMEAIAGRAGVVISSSRRRSHLSHRGAAQAGRHSGPRRGVPQSDGRIAHLAAG